MANDKENAANIVGDNPVDSSSPSSTIARDETKLGLMKTLKRFLAEVRVEMKKTKWPTRDELTKYVTVVVITIVAVAIFLYISDVVSAQIMKIVGITPEVGN